MDSLWPNDDGRSWRYDQHYESFDTNGLIVDNEVRIFFDGVAIAPTAIDVQYLREQVVTGPAFQAALASTGGSPFLRQLRLARPDLVEKIARAVTNGTCPENAPAGAYTLLLDGELAYKKTAGEIAAWRCNLADTRSWQWLVSDLTIGNTFTLPLIPDLASDVYLHGRIAAIEPATVPAGTYPGCVRVDYTIDYGLSQCTDESGTPIGTSRSETHGWVRYAPDVGPVESFEEFVRFVEATGTCAPPGEIGAVTARATLKMNSAPTPTRPTSWGRLKAIYR